MPFFVALLAISFVSNTPRSLKSLVLHFLYTSWTYDTQFFKTLTYWPHLETVTYFVDIMKNSVFIYDNISNLLQTRDTNEITSCRKTKFNYYLY